jgi:hypothetical protein
MRTQHALLGMVILSVATLVMTGFALAEFSFNAPPFEFDPGNTGTVVAQWVKHLGLPDPDDDGHSNFALLLSKNTATPTVAAAGAQIRGVMGISLIELGYDFRSGGHCGAGAPRFNVVTTDNVLHFIGCNSPSPTASGALPGFPGWTRLRWTATGGVVPGFPPVLPTQTVQSITIIFDEGTDQGNSSGMAVIDNIDINGVLIGSP